MQGDKRMEAFCIRCGEDVPDNRVICAECARVRADAMRMDFIKPLDAPLPPVKQRMVGLSGSIGESVIARRVGSAEGYMGEVQTNVPWTVVHHSPDGYEWGYGGSGPTDFALNILNYFVPPGTDGFVPVKCFNGIASQTAWSLRHKFTDSFICGMNSTGGEIPAFTIITWFKSLRHTVTGETLAERREQAELEAAEDAEWVQAELTRAEAEEATDAMQVD